MERNCSKKSKNANDRNYICNPKTGRWVRKDGPTGKLLLVPKGGRKSCNKKSKNANDRNYICNPISGRWVRKNGPTGKQLAYRRSRIGSKGLPSISSVYNIPSISSVSSISSSSNVGDSLRRRLYNQPVRNYRCMNPGRSTHITLDNCSRDVSNVNLKDVIGEGGFGVVYGGSGTYKGRKTDIALKIIKNANINEIFEEIEYSYYMSDVGLGPKVYDAFFTKVGKTYKQYIIMEPFDGGGVKALLSNDITKREKEEIIIRMAQILYKQIFQYGLECYDIKPDNFVYRKKRTVVKLIDFGKDWCNFIPERSNRRKKLIYLILLVQLGNLIKDLGTNVDVIDTLDNIDIFRRRMNYVDDMYRELMRNDQLKQVFKHYTIRRSMRYFQLDNFKTLVEFLNF